MVFGNYFTLDEIISNLVARMHQGKGRKLNNLCIFKSAPLHLSRLNVFNL
ncbi:hypothetical protein GMMP15_1260007 [Candidatus Magnetomoraceae bacterium gMMP-15]